LVNAPATLGLAYNTSPSTHVSDTDDQVVLIFLTLPKVVINPSFPFVISSVATQRTYIPEIDPFAVYFAIVMIPEAPSAPFAYTTLAFEMVAPV